MIPGHEKAREVQVAAIIERRPAKGDWARAGYHHDWIQFQIHQ
jgi:hypothetical protein